jgi:hypothetical protein
VEVDLDGEAKTAAEAEEGFISFGR